MGPAPPRSDAQRGDSRVREVILAELERRLSILETAEEDSFGRFTAIDWTVCVVLFALLPLLLVWWCAP